MHGTALGLQVTQVHNPKIPILWDAYFSFNQGLTTPRKALRGRKELVLGRLLARACGSPRRDTPA
jgi:hypothetical protein